MHIAYPLPKRVRTPTKVLIKCEVGNAQVTEYLRFCQSDIICENPWNLWETLELGGDIETGTGFFHAGHVTVPNYFGVWICDAQLLDEGVHGAPLF